MFTLNCKGRLVVVDNPIVMGILNLTPDSFFTGSRINGLDQLYSQAEKMLTDGAMILDLGGQSTRPGSVRVSEEEELKRIVEPVAQLAEKFPEALISIDTFYARVAEETINAGAHIVNDISAGLMDEAMLPTVGRLGVPYICMHMQGTPDTMQQNPVYENVTLEVLDFFIERIHSCKKNGINDIIIDPGFGFGKTIAHNFQLLKELSSLRMPNAPMMVGLSRKGTIYKTLGTSADEALNGTTVLNTAALLKGASILRVHDVKEAMEAVKLVAHLV